MTTMQTSMKPFDQTVKTRIGRFLRDVGFGFADWLSDIAERIDPILPKETQMERDLSVQALLGAIHASIEHPCPVCKGKGAVTVGKDDVGTCLNCKGTRVDPNYVISPEL